MQRAGFAATKLDVMRAGAAAPPHAGDVLDIVARVAPCRARPRACRGGLPGARRGRGAGPRPALEEVELHEVGAVDAIVDVTGAVAGLRLLGIERCLRLAAAPGPRRGAAALTARCRCRRRNAGAIARAGAPIAEGEGPRGELVTPTGAAILTTLGRFQRPAMRIESVGYGAGGRDPADRPNVLRVWLGEAETPARRMRVIETNIDDMTPELLAYAQEKLFAAGAADVWFTPIQMKKNRPAVMLSRPLPEGAGVGARRSSSCARPSTLGVRVREVGRYEAEREVFEFESSLGPAAVKVKRLPGEAPRIAPEFEVCRRIAQEQGLPLAEVYRIVAAEAEVRPCVKLSFRFAKVVSTALSHAYVTVAVLNGQECNPRCPWK